MRFSLRTIVPALVIAAAACSESSNPTSPLVGADDPMLRLANRDFFQLERMGLPAIATVFIPAARKDAFNTGQPVDDAAAYTGDIVAVLTSFGHPNPAGLAAALLPDAIPFRIGSSAGFLNGRRLRDDVITAELGLIFGANTALNDDQVDANDKAFPGTFPYLAEPHQ